MKCPECITVEQNVRLFARPRRVGILGGTFNPPHNGHVDMAHRVKGEFSLDEVCLMPCGNPPHKTEGLAPKEMRLQMTRMCAAGTDVNVLDFEVKKRGYSYTVETLEALREKNPETDYYFIVGEDTVFELCTWHAFERLFKLTKFICVRRQNHDILRLSAEISRLQWSYGAQIFLSEYTGLFVSSSYIRKRIGEGRGIEGLVPKNVEEYIIANGLYRKP